ncbi:S-layer homology domain-containing protein [Ureibacillus sinduriensis]|uniref:SLH domain-containing protein n=1 Tax=Ureibacillus sinduriensis BLB-1 = JCM 15800 TaxID=1384057 RepID=A0A0A3HVQ3_9BACL|nr:S-layer homology domain-containing protein [Ureibacillus sinduriensis]KGR76534.1 hypothetical protein CD33_06605 [Ureibacillus sinduriensis BLB-1 = JCM 15800]
MSKKHKLFASTATAALVASAIVPVASAAALNDFDSVPSYAKEAVQQLADNNILQGDANGNFNPSKTLTRAEAAEVLSKALKLEATGTENFSDVKAGDWFYDAVVATSPELFEGDGTGKFDPKAQLTRAQAAKVIVLAYGLTGEADLSNYSDLKDVPAWAKEFFATAVENGIINGKTATTLAPNAKISRAEFAAMVKRSIDTVADVTVESVSAVNDITVNEGEKVSLPETVEVTLSNEEKAQKEVKWDVTALDTTKPGVYTVKGDVADTDLEASVKVTVVAVAPEVVNVSAINVKEIKVSFNKAVSKDSFAGSDFVVTNTATAAPIVVSDAQLATDGKSATLLLASNIPATGVDVNIAEGALLAANYDKFAKSSTKALKAAEDTTAPKLLSATYVGGANIELTFDEPVNFGTYTGGKIDQTTATVQPVNSTKAGKYVYTISAAATLSNGTHTVDLTNVTDFAGNTDVLISKDVVVSQDTSATKVASITANDSTSFIVEFSKAVTAPAASNFEIKKGNLTLDTNNFTVTPALVDADGNAVANGVTSSKFVKVTVAETQANTANPLYATNENAVNLSVKVSGYTDASTVLGTEFSGSVTLSKDLTAPAIKSDKLITSTATTIVIPFDQTLTGDVDSKITVKQGNVLVAQTATSANKDLTLTFGAGLLEEGKTYTITLDKGAVVSGTKESEATTVQYTVPTSATTYTTTAPGVAASKVNGKNVLTLTYAGKVNDAAGLASAYKLNDAALPAGTEVYFASTAKTSVVIELPSTYTVNTEDKAAKFTINADTVQYDSTYVAEANKFISGSLTTSKAYETAITLKDNVAPVVSKVEYVKDASGLATGLKLTFSEAIDDSSVDAANFVVTQGTTPVGYTVAAGAPATTDLVDDNILNLTFSTPVVASGLVLNTNTDTTKLTLTDANGNLLGTISPVSAQ